MFGIARNMVQVIMMIALIPVVVFANGCAKAPTPSTNATPPQSANTSAEPLPYTGVFWSHDTQAVRISLGMGDLYSGKINEIVKADYDPNSPSRTNYVHEPVTEAKIIFWILDPYKRKIVDAGTIAAPYRFSFIALDSGPHILVFDPKGQGLRITLHSNFAGPYERVRLVQQ